MLRITRVAPITIDFYIVVTHFLTVIHDFFVNFRKWMFVDPLMHSDVEQHVNEGCRWERQCSNEGSNTAGGNWTDPPMQGQETLARHGIVVARAGSTAVDQTTFVVGVGNPARIEGWITYRLHCQHLSNLESRAIREECTCFSSGTEAISQRSTKIRGDLAAQNGIESALQRSKQDSATTNRDARIVAARDSVATLDPFESTAVNPA